MTALDLETQHTIATISQITAIVSFCGSLFVIACFVLFKHLRSFAFTLVFYVSLCDLVSGFSKVLGTASLTNETLCTLQAVMMSFGDLTSVMWVCAIAFTLHQAFLRQNPKFAGSEVKNRAKAYHMIIWGFGLLLTVLPLLTSSYGIAGGWCWIIPESPWRYIQFYIPLWCAWGYCLYVYSSVYIKLKAVHSSHGQDDNQQRKVLRRIMYYPFILVLFWFPASLNRLVEAFGAEVAFLGVLHSLGQGLFGAANALVYGLTPAVQQTIRSNLCGGAPPAASESSMSENPASNV